MRKVNILILLVFGALFFLRLYNLDADPPLWKRIGDMFDEGVWIHNARNLVLFGRAIIDDFNQGFVSSLTTLFWYGSFKLFGVNFFSARIVPALSGFLILILIYVSLYKVWGKRTAFISLLTLGFNGTFLTYNRLGTLEMPLMLFQVLCLIFLYMARKRRFFYFLCGIFFGLSLLVKAYVLFALVILLIRLFEVLAQPDRKRGKFFLYSLLLMLFGLASVIIPYWFFFVKKNLAVFQYVFRLCAKNNLALGPADFLYKFFTQLISLFSIDILAQAPVFLLLLIALPFIIWVIANPEIKIRERIKKIDTVFAYLLIWLFGGLIIAQTTTFVDRRQVLFIVPLALLAAKIVSTSLPDNKSIAKLSDCRLALIFIGLVVAYYELLWRFIFKTQVVSGFNLHKVPLLLATGLLFSALFITSSLMPKLKIFFSRWLPLVLLLSLISLALVKVIYLWSVEVFGYIRHIGSLQLSIIVILSAVFLLLVIYKNLNIYAFISKKFVFAVLSLYFLVNMFEIYAGVIKPTFTLRNESRRLGELVPMGGVVSGSFALEMGIENTIFPLDQDTYETDKKRINESYPAGYYLAIRDFNWQLERCRPKIANLKYLATFKLFPSLFKKDKFKLTLDLYSGTKETIYNWELSAKAKKF